MKEMEQLKQRLQEADKRDQEKDTEIKMLQKCSFISFYFPLFFNSSYLFSTS